jgi:hypothetical protein
MDRTKASKFTVGMVGLAAVGLLAMTQGCSSSNGGSGTGGKGGATTGTGGHATGGAAGGGAGMTGTDSGTDGPAACAPVTDTPITDFGPDGGTTSSAGIGAPYAFAGTVANPTFSTTTGALVITINAGAPDGGAGTYAGVGLSINRCIDASAFHGVKFNAFGTLSAGCTIQFSLVDELHSTSPPFGMGAPGSYAGAKVFTLPAAAADVTVLFSEIGAGSPATPIVDPSKAINVQWQFNVPATGCTGSVTIDNVAFVP